MKSSSDQPRASWLEASTVSSPPSVWVSSLPGGTSGLIGDPHYVDLLPEWLTNESYPQFLRRSDLLPTFESIERFAPG